MTLAFRSLRPKKGFWNRRKLKKESLKRIFSELGSELDPSVRVNLANSVVHKIPHFKRLGHPPIETEDRRNVDYYSSTRHKNCRGLRRSTDRYDRLRYPHDFETMRETTAYCNHIKNSEIETREFFEQETLSPENIQRTLPMNIVT